MKYLGQENNLLFFEDIPMAVVPGCFMRIDGVFNKVVYVDHDNGELGCLPATKKETRMLLQKMKDHGAGNA